MNECIHILSVHPLKPWWGDNSKIYLCISLLNLLFSPLLDLRLHISDASMNLPSFRDKIIVLGTQHPVKLTGKIIVCCECHALFNYLAFCSFFISIIIVRVCSKLLLFQSRVFCIESIFKNLTITIVALSSRLHFLDFNTVKNKMT